MSFLKKRAENEEEFQMNEFEVGRTYIDLGQMKGKGTSDARAGGPSIRFADIDGYRQIPDLSNLIYEGNILILDFTPIANDDLELKRTITELKRVIEDIEGDIAGIGQNLLLVTPKGMHIDKKKLKKNRK
jgi:SepF-like predicted cell division protein (DUF552 family)